MKNDVNAFVGRVRAHELAWHRPGKLCGAHKSFTDPKRARPALFHFLCPAHILQYPSVGALQDHSSARAFGGPMTSTAILLVLLSALIHTAWSLIAKRAPKTAPFYAVTILLGLLFCSPICLPHIARNPQILAAWPLFTASGVLLAVYYFLMYRTYRRADLSLAYPLLRISPIFITVWAILMLGERISPNALVGIAATVVGCMILPQQSLRAVRDVFRISNYMDKTYLMALIASLMTTGYVVIDKQAMARFNAGSDFRTAFDYVYLEMWVCCLGLALISLYHLDRESIRALIRTSGVSIVIIAPMLIGAWVLILAALSLPGERVAYVGAFRQVSVVLTVAGGVLLLKERFGRVRIFAALVIFAGLLLIGFG